MGSQHEESFTAKVSYRCRTQREMPYRLRVCRPTKTHRIILTRAGKGIALDFQEAPRQALQDSVKSESDEHNLLERLKKYETAALLFPEKVYALFTNNRAVLKRISA